LIHPIPRDIWIRSTKLALPVAGAYLVIFAGLAAEFLIVGRALGGVGLAAIGLAGTFTLVLVLAFHALEIAVQAIAARRYGEGNREAAGAALDNGLLVSMVLGVPLSVALWYLGPWIFQSADSEAVAKLATTYFRWRVPGIPLLIGSLVIIGFFNAISRPIVPAALYGVILLLNGLLCWGLVGGHLGLPEMGIAGAGLAQTISLVCGVGLFCVVLALPRVRRRYGVFRMRRNYDPKLIVAILKLSGPVFVQQFLGNAGMFLFVLINSRVPDGGISLSATTITRQIGYLTYLPSLGFGIAAATLVGQYLGAKEPHRAAQSGYVCWLMGAIMMGVTGIAFIVFRDPLVQLFISHPRLMKPGAATGADDLARVAEMAGMIMVLIGTYQILESVNTIVGKALQGAGETYFVMMVSIGSQFLVFLPLAWFLALPMELGAWGSALAFALSLAFSALLLAFRFRAPGWRKVEV